MLNKVRAPINRALEPVVRAIARSGVKPDVITTIGTIGVAGGALGFYTRGVFFIGTVVITAFVFSDLLDGMIARYQNASSTWGAFLDSSLDRIGDGAIFGSLVIWYAGNGHSVLLAGVALFVLVMGSVTSYIKARAQSLGLSCDVGFAERAERLIIVLVAAGLYGLGCPLPAARGAVVPRGGYVRDGGPATGRGAQAGLRPAKAAPAHRPPVPPAPSRPGPLRHQRTPVARLPRTMPTHRSARTRDAGARQGPRRTPSAGVPCARCRSRSPDGSLQRVADQAWRRQGKSVRRLRANLARVSPDADLDALTRQGIRSYARYWLEVFRLPDMPAERIVGNMYVRDEERIFEAHARGKGVILALPHMGNWDHAGAWLVHRGIPFTTVAERLQPESLFDRFVEFRESLGMEVIALAGTGGAAGTRSTVRPAGRAARGGPDAVPAQRARPHPQRRPGHVLRRDRHDAGRPRGVVPAHWGNLASDHCLVYTGRVGRPDSPAGGPHTDIATMTQTMADNFAAAIAAHPQDWHMFQRLWRADLGYP